MARLTPDERFAFDVRGYAVIPGALDAAALTSLSSTLDVRPHPAHRPSDPSRRRFHRRRLPAQEFEALGQRYQAAHPEVEDERIEVVEGKSVGLHIQDWGQKLWIFDLLSEAPALAPALAANAAVKRYVSELVERPALGLLAARYQWKGAESRIHGSFVRSAEAGPGVRAGSVVDSTGSAPAFRVTTEGADRTPRLQSSAFRLMYMLSDIEPGGGAL